MRGARSAQLASMAKWSDMRIKVIKFPPGVGVAFLLTQFVTIWKFGKLLYKKIMKNLIFSLGTFQTFPTCAYHNSDRGRGYHDGGPHKLCVYATRGGTK